MNRWLRRAGRGAKAARREAGRQGAELVNRSDEVLSEQLGETWEGAKERTTRAKVALQRLADQGTEAGRQGVSRIGSTDAGTKAGAAARAVLGELARMPVITAVSDGVQAKNATQPLLERVRAEPDDVWANLYAGEALRAVERDMGFYVRFRAVTDPSSVLLRVAVRSAAALGPSGEPSDESAGEGGGRFDRTSVDGAEILLRRAYAIALARTRSDGADLDAFHAIARVYLAQAMPGAAHRALHTGFDRAVADGAPPDASALTTLSRASLALGRNEEARGHASAAIGLGCSIGYEVLADLVFDGPSSERSAGERVTAFVSLMERVTDEDRSAYYGINRSASTVIRTFNAEQWSKTKETASRGVATGRRSLATARGLSPSRGRLLTDRGRGTADAVKSAWAESGPTGSKDE